MVGTNEQTPVPPPIDSLSESELRQETIERINTVLGEYRVGPVADGTATDGYDRKEQGLSSLSCSYFQFSKAYRGEEQVGVQIALLGLGDVDIPTFSLGYYKEELNKRLKKAPSSDEDKQELTKLIDQVRRLEESVAKDGIAPADNRYYFIPLDSVQPAIVSTESFMARAHRVNPQMAERGFLPEVIAEAKGAENQPIDEASGQPRSKIANLQDLRDALAIVRGGDWFVKDIIGVTPKKNWGRPGLTD